MKKLFGNIELLLTAIIWGFAFVAQTAGLEHVSTFTLSVLRSFIAFVFLSILAFIISLVQKENSFPKNRAEFKSLIFGGILCGIALFVATNLQQFGISLYPKDAGASGRAGFITALYVVFVAIIGSLLYRRKNHPLVWCGVVLAIVGMYMLCLSGGVNNIYLGDVVVFLCAFAFCGHILTVDHFVKKNNGLLLSCVQFFTMGVLSLIFMLIFESPDWSAVGNSLVSVVYLGVMSSGVAYTLQIVGQKNTDPTVASIIMSLESVFAVIGGWLILGERLSSVELVGCGFVFAAIIVAQSPGFIKKK